MVHKMYPAIKHQVIISAMSYSPKDQKHVNKDQRTNYPEETINIYSPDIQSLISW